MAPVSGRECGADCAAKVSQSPLLAGLEDSAFAAVVGAQRVGWWPAGAVVMQAADTTVRFHILLEGRVKLVRQRGGNGRELTLCLFGPGDGFDVVGLLDGRPHEITLQALDEVRTCSAPTALWRIWIDESVALRRNLLHYVAAQLRHLDELAGAVALDDTMTRLAHLLLRHFDDQRTASHPNLIRDLPHEELAHLIGSVRVVVTRLLGRLRRAGMVETVEGRLHVPDLKRLWSLAESRLDRRSDEQ